MSVLSASAKKPNGKERNPYGVRIVTVPGVILVKADHFYYRIRHVLPIW